MNKIFHASGDWNSLVAEVVSIHQQPMRRIVCGMGSTRRFLSFPDLIFKILSYRRGDEYSGADTYLYVSALDQDKNLIRFMPEEYTIGNTGSHGHVCLGNAVRKIKTNSIDELCKLILHRYWSSKFLMDNYYVRKWQQKTKEYPAWIPDISNWSSSDLGDYLFMDRTMFNFNQIIKNTFDVK